MLEVEDASGSSGIRNEEAEEVGRIPVQNHEVAEVLCHSVQPDLHPRKVEEEEEEEDRRCSGSQKHPQQLQQQHAALVHVRNLRALVSCWCAYERRWVQTTQPSNNSILVEQRQQPQHRNIEAYIVDEEFELELENFHALVTHNVTNRSAVESPRKSLEAFVSTWVGMEKRVRDWWTPREDIALACATDLRLVVPNVWIGSALTLQHADAIASMQITHILHCCTSERLPQHPTQIVPVVRTAASPFRSTFAYTITLSELPRLEFLQQSRNAARKASAKQPAATWEELDATSKFLFQLLRVQDRFAASALRDPEEEDEESESTAASKAAEIGLLLYCDSGVSTSVTVCAALLMYRFCLPLEDAMLLLRTARRFVAPSKYLVHQLEMYDLELQRRRQGLRLPLHALPV